MTHPKTFVNLRAYIKESLQYEISWYEYMEFQKDFREKMRQFQKEVSCDTEFIMRADVFYNELDYYLIDVVTERDRVEKLFKEIFSNCETWSLVVYETHPEEVFLKNLHPKLKKALSKPLQLCLF